MSNIKEMSDEKIAIRVLLRHYWKKGLSTRAAVKEICSVEGEGSVSKSTASEWFQRFSEGDLSFHDKPRSGRPSTVNEQELCAALQKQPHSSASDLAATLGTCKQTVCNHLHQLEYINKRRRVDPYDITDAQARGRVELCCELLMNPLDDRFWKRIITCDEKWIFLVNHNRTKQWVKRGQQTQPIVRQDRFGKKVMLCVWWNYEGVIHFELIPDGQAINAELYSEQLHRVYNVVQEKYPALINRKRALLQQDNAPAHRSRLTQQTIAQLDGFEVLPHPPYSPDMAPSDYGLFRSMEHFLRGRRFDSVQEVEEACQQFFASKNPEWYFNQIRLLAKRWKMVIENDGLYFDD
jgi:[histone H3]-lysine36 N-dimethyltransferase SETMAR